MSYKDIRYKLIIVKLFSGTRLTISDLSKGINLKPAEHNRNVAAAFGLRTISSLHNPVYRTYFFGMLGQFASMSMQMVVNSYLIYHLTGSPALLGTMSLAHALPMIIISMFGGAVADRIQKKYVVITGLLASAALALGVAVTLTTGYLSRDNTGSWWILVAASFLTGVVFGMLMPARQAIIPEIVSREQTMNAIALNMMGMNVLTLIGPAVTGFLIDSLGFASVYYVIGALNIYAAVMVVFVPRTSPAAINTGNIMADIKKGFQYIRKDTTILFVLLFTLIVVILSMPYQQLLPIYVDDILKVGATGLGVLMSVSGVGALAGSLALAASPNKKRGLMLIVSGLVSGVALLCFAFSTNWILSLAIMVFIGLGQTVRGTAGSALLQSYAEPAYMGRVMSIMMMQWGCMALCTFFAGLMAEVIPVQWVVGSLAIGLIIISVAAIFMAPRIRKLD